MKTHWKKLRNPDYLGAYSFDEGQDKILTIKSVAVEVVKTAEGAEDCTIVRWVENEKPMILNVTNAKMIQKLLKTSYIEDWAGRQIQLYAAQVKAFGEMTDAVRVRAYLPAAVKCTDCKADIKAAAGKTAAWLAGYTLDKYGRKLCAECATKAATPTETKEETAE